jgi:hypothetical protein
MKSDAAGEIHNPDITPLTGDELLLPGVRVREFWAWAMGDLRLNSTRGSLAQFLVARAVGDTRANDDGWGDFDVLSPEGIRIEVKSSGYLQSWVQKKVSAITFSGLTGRTWSAESGYGLAPEVRADVFVFAVHTSQDPDTYDPLALSAWDFYVVPGSTVRSIGQKTIGLNRVRKIAGNPIGWSDLRQAILGAAAE